MIIDIINDAVPEENEFFEVSLSIHSSSTSVRYQVHTPLATVTIIDDDGKSILLHMNTVMNTI